MDQNKIDKNKTSHGTHIEIRKVEGRIIFQGAITDLPLRESYIIEKSMELFHESEPCIIYRTHIAKRFHLELYEMLMMGEQQEIGEEKMKEFLSIVNLDIGDGRVVLKRG